MTSHRDIIGGRKTGTILKQHSLRTHAILKVQWQADYLPKGSWGTNRLLTTIHNGVFVSFNKLLNVSHKHKGS